MGSLWMGKVVDIYCCIDIDTLKLIPAELQQQCIHHNVHFIIEAPPTQQNDIFETLDNTINLHSVRYAFQPGTEQDVLQTVHRHMVHFDSVLAGIYPLSSRFGKYPTKEETNEIEKFDTEEFIKQIESVIQTSSSIQQLEYTHEIQAHMNGIATLPGFGLPTYAISSSNALFSLNDRMNHPHEMLSTLDYYNHPDMNSNCAPCRLKHICGGFRPFDFTTNFDQNKLQPLFDLYCRIQKRLIHQIILKLYQPK
jgi:hypothetical protein